MVTIRHIVLLSLTVTLRKFTSAAWIDTFGDANTGGKTTVFDKEYQYKRHDIFDRKSKLIILIGAVSLLLLSACASQGDASLSETNGNLGKEPAAEASEAAESVESANIEEDQDVVSEAADTQDEQTALSAEQNNANKDPTTLPEPEFIPEDMYAFFGIPNEEASDSKTYYIQYAEKIKTGGFYMDTPSVAIWEAGTDRVTVDRMLAKELVSAIEKKYGYKNEKMPYIGRENPSWYHSRFILRISDDSETPVLLQPVINYYDYNHDPEIDAWDYKDAEFETLKCIFLNEAFVREEKGIICSIDTDCKGYVWYTSEEYDSDMTSHWRFDITATRFDSSSLMRTYSEDMKLGAVDGVGHVWVYDLESGEKIYGQAFERGFVQVLELTNDTLLYLWDDERNQPIYYLYDFRTGVTKAYKERFNASMLPHFWSFGGYKISGRYFVSRIINNTMRICDRITGEVTEIHSKELGEASLLGVPLVLEKNFVRSFITLP
jgi:hypothetical protein